MLTDVHIRKIPVELLARAKAAAALDGTTLSAYLVDAIKARINAHPVLQMNDAAPTRPRR